MDNQETANQRLGPIAGPGVMVLEEALVDARWKRPGPLWGHVQHRVVWALRWLNPAYGPFWMERGPRASLRHAVSARWLRPGMRILELGCGLGHGAAWLSEQGLDVLAVDFAPSAIARARRLHPPREGLAFQVADACAAEPGIPGPFDAVVDSGCLHSIAPRMRGGYVANILRWIPPGKWYVLALHLAGVTPDQQRQTVEDLFLPSFAIEEEAMLEYRSVTKAVRKNIVLLLVRR